MNNVFQNSEANKRQVGGSHYKKQGLLEHWDLVAIYGWDYFTAQIIKYLMRWRDKNGVQDLEKAAHYLQKYIETQASDEARTAKGLEKHARTMPVPDLPLELGAHMLTDYAKPGEIAATGWIGYTHEGADANGFHFRCKTCLERFYTAPDGNPHRVHKCSDPPVNDGDATPAYVAQNGGPAKGRTG